MMEEEKFIENLLGLITVHRYVNAYSEAFLYDKELFKAFHTNLIKEYNGLLIEMDIQKFRTCETDDDEALIIREVINNSLKKKNFSTTIEDAISITGALEKLSTLLSQSALMVFHLFTDEFDEKEKDILRSIRKFLEIYEKPPLLGVLILSHKTVYHWELYPESNLDDRHVEFVEYQ